MKGFIVLGLLASGAVGAQSYDTVEGSNAFNHNTTGDYDSVFGANTMFYNTQGYYNSAFGFNALQFNSTSNYNTAFGAYAAYQSISGFNTAVGMEALYGNQTGTNNIALGYFAGGVPTSGSNNILIGNYGLTKDSAVIRIGTQGTQKFAQIAGIFGVKLPTGGGQALYVNSKGQIGVLSTAIVKSANPATQADVLALRQEIAALKNEVYALKAKR